MNLVRMHDVSVAYDGYEALEKVDLEIGADDFLGVIGPNGGGKTTLVKAILGAVPYTGTIEYAPELFHNGERLIGYMPQISDFDRAFPISLLEVVLSGLQGRRGFCSRYTKDDRRKALQLLEEAGIPVEYECLVPNIINRAGDGICPVESLCADARTPEECLPRIGEFVRRMREGRGPAPEKSGTEQPDSQKLS